MLYVLLTIITVGVLLISKEGKGILRLCGCVLLTGGILSLGILLLAGSAWVISQIWLPVIGLAVALVIWVLVFVAAPNQINKMLNTDGRKRAFWTVLLICLVILFIYRLYSNFYHPLCTSFIC